MDDFLLRLIYGEVELPPILLAISVYPYEYPNLYPNEYLNLHPNKYPSKVRDLVL